MRKMWVTSKSGLHNLRTHQSITHTHILNMFTYATVDLNMDSFLEKYDSIYKMWVKTTTFSSDLFGTISDHPFWAIRPQKSFLVKKAWVPDLFGTKYEYFFWAIQPLLNKNSELKYLWALMTQ